MSEWDALFKGKHSGAREAQWWRLVLIVPVHRRRAHLS